MRVRPTSESDAASAALAHRKAPAVSPPIALVEESRSRRAGQHKIEGRKKEGLRGLRSRKQQAIIPTTTNGPAGLRSRNRLLAFLALAGRTRKKIGSGPLLSCLLGTRRRDGGAGIVCCAPLFYL